MESCNSCSGSTASAIPANMALSLGVAIRDEDKEHSSPIMSSRISSSASEKKAQEMRIEGGFKCKFCPRAFKTARARGGHQKAHRRQLLAPKEKKKTNKGRRPVWSPASACSYATALRSACLRAHPFGDWRSYYEPSVQPAPYSSFPWRRSAGSLAAAVAVGRAGDGGRLGRQQDVRGVILEEPADGIDLTLKL